MVLLGVGGIALAAAVVSGALASPGSATVEESLSNQLVDTAADRGLVVEHSAFRWGVAGDPVAMMGGGLCWIDVDDDGWLDLFVTDTWSEGEWALWHDEGALPTTRLFRNDAGNFEDVTETWGAGFAVRGLGCTVADLEGDGDPDLYVTTSRANLVLVNTGEAFVEVGAESGAGVYGWQAGAAAGDINGDGLVDLFVTGYADVNTPRSSDSGFPNTVAAREDLVLLGVGSEADAPQFEVVEAGEIGVEPDGPEYGLDVVMADADGDGDLDVYVANDTQPNRLYRNDFDAGDDFTDISTTAQVDDGGSSMGIATADLNEDHVPDFAVTNLAGQGHGVFLSEGLEVEWANAQGALSELGMAETGWGVAFVDLNSDGQLDSIAASGEIPIVDDTQPLPLSVFQGTSGGGFEPWEAIANVPNLNGRAVAPADFDNDGDIDLAITSISGALVLLENQLNQGTSVLVDAGHAPAGTIVRLHFEDGGTVQRQITSGGNWLSAADPRVHIGYEPTRTPATIDVGYPDGTMVSAEVPASGGIVRMGVNETSSR